MPPLCGVWRSPNGHTLVCEGRFARFFEVTEDNEIVWDCATRLLVTVTVTGPTLSEIAYDLRVGHSRNSVRCAC